jgi:hypothetical protein
VTDQPKAGDQPLPDNAATAHVCVQDAVAEHWHANGRRLYADFFKYLADRKELGVHRYGQALHVNNGRDATRDAFEEAFDLVMYVAQMILERDGELPSEYYPEDRPTDELFVLFDLAQESMHLLGRILIDRDNGLPEVVIG